MNQFIKIGDQKILMTSFLTAGEIKSLWSSLLRKTSCSMSCLKYTDDSYEIIILSRSKWNTQFSNLEASLGIEAPWNSMFKSHLNFTLLSCFFNYDTSGWEESFFFWNYKETMNNQIVPKFNPAASTDGKNVKFCLNW